MPESTLMFIHALTGLHPGSGVALGVVDLPVQRERHTDWPIVPGSSLKGVMRADSIRRAGKADEDTLALFGPEPTDAHEHAGAISFSDARILAFPVRSLTGVFAWVTCPAVLVRLARDLGVVGAGLPEFPSPDRDTITCADASPLLASDGRIMLEEFEFTRHGGATDIADWIASRAVRDEGTAKRLRSHLAVLHDDDFTHFARNATEVVARVGLDYELKTVRQGALFYEEYLPPETLFYALVTAGESRRATRRASAEEVMSQLTSRAPSVLQIGGGETVGKGFCAVRFAGPSAEARR